MQTTSFDRREWHPGDLVWVIDPRSVGRWEATIERANDDHAIVTMSDGRQLRVSLHYVTPR
jgi:hypothetical protein